MWCCNFTLHRKVMWSLKMFLGNKQHGQAGQLIPPKMAWLPTLLFRYWSVRGKSTPAADPVDLLAIQAGEGQIAPGAGRILRSNCEECPGPHVNRKWQADTEVNSTIGRLQHQKIVGRAQVRRSGFGRDETPHLWWKATKRQRKAMVTEEISRAPGEVNHVGRHHQLIIQPGRPMEDATVEAQFLAEGNL